VGTPELGASSSGTFALVFGMIQPTGPTIDEFACGTSTLACLL